MVKYKHARMLNWAFPLASELALEFIDETTVTKCPYQKGQMLFLIVYQKTKPIIQLSAINHPTASSLYHRYNKSSQP
jgi:hypothetical protein